MTLPNQHTVSGHYRPTSETSLESLVDRWWPPLYAYCWMVESDRHVRLCYNHTVQWIVQKTTQLLIIIIAAKKNHQADHNRRCIWTVNDAFSGHYVWRSASQLPSVPWERTINNPIILIVKILIPSFRVRILVMNVIFNGLLYRNVIFGVSFKVSVILLWLV